MLKKIGKWLAVMAIASMAFTGCYTQKQATDDAKEMLIFLMLLNEASTNNSGP